MITFIKKLLWLHKTSILAASETSLEDSAEARDYRRRSRAAFPITRGMDKYFYFFSYVSQQFLFMVLLENLFPQSSTFKSSLEENRVQHTGISHTCSLCSSTAWHPSPLAGPTVQLLGAHPQLQMPSCISSCSRGDAPGSCGYLMNGSNSLDSQLYILATIGRERPVYRASSLPSVAEESQQPVSANQGDGNSALFQHRQVVRSGCGGGFPFALSEDDLCHFYQDIAHISKDEHL